MCGVVRRHFVHVYSFALCFIFELNLCTLCIIWRTDQFHVVHVSPTGPASPHWGVTIKYPDNNARRYAMNEIA